MKAVEISEFGKPEVLKLVERPDPFPAPDEILIEVAAAGVNRPDVVQRMGHRFVSLSARPLPDGASITPTSATAAASQAQARP